MGCSSILRQLNTAVFTPMSMVILSKKKSRDPRELPVDQPAYGPFRIRRIAFQAPLTVLAVYLLTTMKLRHLEDRERTKFRFANEFIQAESEQRQHKIE